VNDDLGSVPAELACYFGWCDALAAIEAKAREEGVEPGEAGLRGAEG